VRSFILPVPPPHSFHRTIFLVCHFLDLACLLFPQTLPFVCFLHVCVAFFVAFAAVSVIVLMLIFHVWITLPHTDLRYVRFSLQLELTFALHVLVLSLRLPAFRFFTRFFIPARFPSPLSAFSFHVAFFVLFARFRVFSFVSFRFCVFACRLHTRSPCSFLRFRSTPAFPGSLSFNKRCVFFLSAGCVFTFLFRIVAFTLRYFHVLCVAHFLHSGLRFHELTVCTEHVLLYFIYVTHVFAFTRFDFHSRCVAALPFVCAPFAFTRCVCSPTRCDHVLRFVFLHSLRFVCVVRLFVALPFGYHALHFCVYVAVLTFYSFTFLVAHFDARCVAAFCATRFVSLRFAGTLFAESLLPLPFPFPSTQPLPSLPSARRRIPAWLYAARDTYAYFLHLCWNTAEDVEHRWAAPPLKRIMTVTDTGPCHRHDLRSCTTNSVLSAETFDACWFHLPPHAYRFYLYSCSLQYNYLISILLPFLLPFEPSVLPSRT